MAVGKHKWPGTLVSGFGAMVYTLGGLCLDFSLSLSLSCGSMSPKQEDMFLCIGMRWLGEGKYLTVEESVYIQKYTIDFVSTL